MLFIRFSHKPCGKNVMLDSNQEYGSGNPADPRIIDLGGNVVNLAFSCPGCGMRTTQQLTAWYLQTLREFGVPEINSLEEEAAMHIAIGGLSSIDELINKIPES